MFKIIALQLFDSAGEKRIFHLPRLITYYKMIMKKIVLICLLFFLFYSCSAPDLASSVCQYDRAEVYYLKDPCWLHFGFNVKLESFSDEQSRCLLYSDFTVTDRDSLNYISRHIAKGAMSASSPYKYWCPRIIVLLHSREVVDTLITNTYTDEPVQFNSFIMNDSTLSLYLTECVGKHDDVWAHFSDLCFYNGNMQMLTYEGDFVTPSEYFKESNIDYIHIWYKVYPSGPLKNK